MTPPKFLTFLLISTFFSISISNAADDALLDKICSRSQDKNFCLQTFLYDQRTSRADLRGLALVSISITNDQISTTLEQKIPEIFKTMTGFVGKARLSICRSDYRAALESFQAAWKSADAKAYWDVINGVRDGTNVVIDCENVYRRVDPISVSPVTDDNHNIIKLSEIILIINDMLLRQ